MYTHSDPDDSRPDQLQGFSYHWNLILQCDIFNLDPK